MWVPGLFWSGVAILGLGGVLLRTFMTQVQANLCTFFSDMYIKVPNPKKDNSFTIVPSSLLSSPFPTSSMISFTSKRKDDLLSYT